MCWLIWLAAHKSGWREQSSPVVCWRLLGCRLNTQLLEDIDPQAADRSQLLHGLSLLDETRLRMIWQHHVTPLLEEYFAGQPQRLEAYQLDDLLDGTPRRGSGKRRRAAPLPR